MAYRQPAVTVTQQFTNTLPALAAFALPHVNVGPAFQVVNQASAGSYAAISANYNYPGQLAGTFVDARPADPADLIGFPVQAFLQNTVVTLKTAVAVGAVDPYNNVNFTDATAGAFANLAIGDVIVVTGSSMGNNGSYTIRQVTSANAVQTNEAFAAVESGLSYTVRRNLQATAGLVTLPMSATGVVVTPTSLTLPAGLTVTVAPFGAVQIVSATVLISFRALRIDKSADVWEYDSTQALQADFGVDQIVPENPVVFAAYISLLSASVTTNLLACDASYLANEVLSFGDAFSILENEDLYAIAVMSFNPSVHTALKAHVDTMSLPANKLERVGIVCRPIVLTASVVGAITTGGSEGFAGTGHLTLTSAASHFLTDGVVPGMNVIVTAPSAIAGSYAIAAVISQTQLLVAGPVASAEVAVTFSIQKNLQKSEQAAFMAAYASSLGDRRMVFVWPDVVRGPVGSVTRDLPGFFLGATVGALTTGLPTQRGFTNLSVSFFTGVRHSTKYFSGNDLNTIAAGGVMIFVQDVLDVSAPYIRHQLTTDTSAIKFQEFSITKNVDFIAKFLRKSHKNFIGKYNVVDNAFDDLKTLAGGEMKFLKEKTKLPQIGGVISNGKLTSAIQDPVNIDSIQETYSLDIPIPLNNLDITIIV